HLNKGQPGSPPLLPKGLLRIYVPFVDVSEADWRKCGSCVGGADRSSSAVWFAPSGSCRCGRRAASRPPPRSAPPFLECSSSLSQTVPPSTSLLPDGSLAPVLSEELSCDAPCWRSS